MTLAKAERLAASASDGTVYADAGRFWFIRRPGALGTEVTHREAFELWRLLSLGHDAVYERGEASINYGTPYLKCLNRALPEGWPS